jgi:P27 family predicted phage terminase small subunit
MAMPRKSLAEHQLNGTRPNYDPNSDVKLEGGRPKCPKGLSPEARRQFKLLARQLQERRQITKADGAALTLYCQAFERHREATERLRGEGIVRLYTRLNNHGEEVEVEKINIWLQVQEKAERFMLATLMQLGLTPQARHKVKQLKSKSEHEVIPGSCEDEFPELFANGKLLSIKSKEEKSDGDVTVD